MRLFSDGEHLCEVSGTMDILLFRCLKSFLSRRTRGYAFFLFFVAFPQHEGSSNIFICTCSCRVGFSSMANEGKSSIYLGLGEDRLFTGSRRGSFFYLSRTSSSPFFISQVGFHGQNVKVLDPPRIPPSVFFSHSFGLGHLLFSAPSLFSPFPPSRPSVRLLARRKLFGISPSAALAVVISLLFFF